MDDRSQSSALCVYIYTYIRARWFYFKRWCGGAVDIHTYVAYLPSWPALIYCCCCCSSSYCCCLKFTLQLLAITTTFDHNNAEGHHWQSRAKSKEVTHICTHTTVQVSIYACMHISQMVSKFDFTSLGSVYAYWQWLIVLGQRFIVKKVHSNESPPTCGTELGSFCVELACQVIWLQKLLFCLFLIRLGNC